MHRNPPVPFFSSSWGQESGHCMWYETHLHKATQFSDQPQDGSLSLTQPSKAFSLISPCSKLKVSSNSEIQEKLPFISPRTQLPCQQPFKSLMGWVLTAGCFPHPCSCSPSPLEKAGAKGLALCSGVTPDQGNMENGGGGGCQNLGLLLPSPSLSLQSYLFSLICAATNLLSNPFRKQCHVTLRPIHIHCGLQRPHSSPCCFLVLPVLPWGEKEQEETQSFPDGRPSFLEDRSELMANILISPWSNTCPT